MSRIEPGGRADVVVSACLLVIVLTAFWIAVRGVPWT
jgi:hypothetical protein